MATTDRKITLVVRTKPRRARYDLIGTVKITPDAEIAQAAACVDIVEV